MKKSNQLLLVETKLVTSVVIASQLLVIYPTIRLDALGPAQRSGVRSFARESRFRGSAEGYEVWGRARKSGILFFQYVLFELVKKI